MERRLKNILHGVGQTSAERDRHRDGFAEKVFETFDANKVLESAPRYNEHFFTVFLCLSEGYGKAQPNVLRPLIELGGALFMSMKDAVDQTAEKFFAKAGYRPAGSPVTLEDLVKTACFRDPQFRVTAPQIVQLKKYLATFDPDNPYIQDNLENLKTFWHVLMAQPAVNTSTPEALADLLFRGILDEVKGADDRQTVTDLLVESLRFTDFGGKPDAAYDKALNFKKVQKNQPIGKEAAQILGQRIYTWLTEYIGAINDDNQHTETVYVVQYGGLLMGRDVKSGDVITPAEFIWAGNQPQNGITAGVEVEQRPTGRFKNRIYEMRNGDIITANRGRAVDYLIAQKRIDPSLKLPILLMLSMGILD